MRRCSRTWPIGSPGTPSPTRCRRAARRLRERGHDEESHGVPGQPRIAHDHVEKAHLGGCGINRSSPVLAVGARHADLLGVLRPGQGPDAFGGHASYFVGHQLGVPVRDQGERDEPPGVSAGPFVDVPVVVGLELPGTTAGRAGARLRRRQGGGRGSSSRSARRTRDRPAGGRRRPRTGPRWWPDRTGRGAPGEPGGGLCSWTFGLGCVVGRVLIVASG